MNDEKRLRSPNWLPAEKELLLRLVEIHFNKIENKKTDRNSIRAKLERWQLISDQYNNQTTLAFRTADNLKAQWESLKKVARKYAANNIKQMSQAVGESPLPQMKEDLFLDRILSLINTGTVGVNENDSDSEFSLVQDLKLLPTSTTKTQRISKPDGFIDVQIIDVTTPQEEVTEDDNSEIETDGILEQTWHDYTPQMLGTPMKHDNKKKINNLRRRSTQSNTLLSLKQDHYKKIEAMELQKNIAANNRAEILHNIELQIKKEKLKQEKIQTSIMLINRRKLLSLHRK